MKIASGIASPLLSLKKNLGTDVFCNIHVGTPFNFLNLPTSFFGFLTGICSSPRIILSKKFSKTMPLFN